MIDQQNLKFVNVSPPVAILDNASATTTVIDTLGWDYCTIVVQLGATDIAMAALKVQEAEATASATALTGGADVTGLVYGTSTNTAGTTSTLPSATDDNTFVAFQVDCRTRMRYLDLVATAGDGAVGTFVSAFAVLGRGSEAPNTAAEQGLGQILRA